MNEFKFKKCLVNSNSEQARENLENVILWLQPVSSKNLAIGSTEMPKKKPIIDFFLTSTELQISLIISPINSPKNPEKNQIIAQIWKLISGLTK